MSFSRQDNRASNDLVRQKLPGRVSEEYSRLDGGNSGVSADAVGK